MKKPIFTGSAVAVCTPFNIDGSVDYSAFERLVDWQIDNGTQAIVVTGTTGENPTVSDEEFENLVRIAIERSAKRVPIVAGAGRNCTSHSIKLSKAAKALGADALLVVSPYYNKTTQAGLVAHIKAIADSTDLPIILYNVPSRTGMSFTADTYCELSKLPTVNGVKEASGNFTLMLQTLHKCPKDFYIYCGNDDQITAMMAIGAVGTISVLANIAPAQTQQICRLCLENKYQESAKIQIDFCGLIDALFVETNPIPVKAALEAMDLCSGTLRLPLVPMGAKNKEALLVAMKRQGLIK